MKNKHLVLLFLVVLVGARLLRNLPPPASENFQQVLFETDITQIRSIQFSWVGQSDTLFFTKTDTQWVASSGRKHLLVPLEVVAPFLKSLSLVRSNKVYKNTPIATKLNVSVVTFNGKTTQLFLGKTATGEILRLNEDPTLFEISQPLMDIFRLHFDSLRSNQVFEKPSPPIGIAASYPDTAPIYLKKNGKFWQVPGGQPKFPATDFLLFFEKIDQIRQLPFEDNFDDSSESETFLGQLTFEFEAGDALKLRCFKGNLRGQYVLSSSQNPKNYFSIPDSLASGIFLFPKNILHIDAVTR